MLFKNERNDVSGAMADANYFNTALRLLRVASFNQKTNTPFRNFVVTKFNVYRECCHVTHTQIQPAFCPIPKSQNVCFYSESARNKSSGKVSNYISTWYHCTYIYSNPDMDAW